MSSARRVFLPNSLSQVLLAAACLAWPVTDTHAADKPAAVARWDRFQITLESTAEYPNPLQDASLTATFTSPQGETIKVPGFWDGGRTWRVRFAPNQTGRWTYATACSDAANKGLDRQSGEFTCTAPAGSTRFAQHGPVRVSPDLRYFTHDDGAPFFWLADTAWNGALKSTDADWTAYVLERAAQKFTAVQFVTTQWRAAPDGNLARQPAFTGTNPITADPKFFAQLDAKIEALNKGGLLAVPVMLWAIQGGSNPSVNPGVSLPEDQAILLGRYMVARWQANAVAWILAGDADYRGEKAARWNRIGRGIFGGIKHAPVTMHPGGQQWVWSEFREEPWYDFVGYQSGHGDGTNALKWLLEGPVTEDWMRMPHKPFINLEPTYEDHVAYQSKKPITAGFTRRALIWSLLVAPTAGVSYGGHGVWGWDDGTKAPVDHPGTGTPKPWREALKLPGAAELKHLADIFTSIDYWRLRPAPMMIVNNPGKDNPERFIAAAKSDQKDLAVIYVPSERTVEVKLDTLPTAPNITWYNPRTGEKNPAVGVVTANTCQFPTPAEGDWLLVMSSQPKDAAKSEKTAP
jgi:hypothetical protein